MEFLVNVSGCGTAFAFCGLYTKNGNAFSKAVNPIYAMHVFDTDLLEFCNAIDSMIQQRELNPRDANQGEISYSDNYEIKVGECMMRRSGPLLSISAGYREILHVNEISCLKKLTKALRKSYNKLNEK